MSSWYSNEQLKASSFQNNGTKINFIVYTIVHFRPRGQQIGFCPLSDDFGISVTFHVLLRKDAWKWNGRNMRICMRFGDHRLGGGLIDVGEFQSRE